MKIAHVNNYFRGMHRYVGGAENATYRTMSIARDQGHDVFAVTLRPDIPDPRCDFRHYGVRRWEDYLPRLLAKYVEPVKWYVWQKDLLASRDFRRILAEEKPDIVHFHNIQFPGLDLIRVAAESGAKICLTVYDYWLFCPNVMLLTGDDQYCRRFHGAHCVECLPPVFRTAQRMLLARRKAIFDRYLKLVDRWIVLSRHSAGVLEAYGIPAAKIRVVRLTLPLEYAADPPVVETKVDPDVIFFAGWLQKRKGVHILLEAMPLILKECPRARLRIAGQYTKFEWDYKAKLKTLLAAPGIREHVELLGHLSPAAVERELRCCAVVAIPEQYENMSPLLMIEAMELGKPLVISRAGGIPEFVEDGATGWLVDPRDVAGFARRIVGVLKRAIDPSVQGRQARERIRQICSPSEIIRATMKAYQFD